VASRFASSFPKARVRPADQFADYVRRMDVTDAEHTYLRDHVWGLLATGRADGAPQMSMVAYDWDGSDLVISCRAQAAKYVNASRNSSVVFAVPDDLNNLTVMGTAICHHSGTIRDQLTERLRDRLADGYAWASTMLDADLATGLDDVGRVIIQIAPLAVSLLKPQG
jgi:hypothetical protein